MLSTNLKSMDLGKNIPVKEFFEGRNIFITGGTGFMGKILIEKLLWSCEDIGKLYMLIRPKKGHDVQERLDEMLKQEIFDRVRERDDKSLSKIVPIAGDVMDINLGINEKERKLLEDSVSIVFHAASSVRFDDPLKKAIILNIRGTREVVNISKSMINLKAMIYVSTTYANTDKQTIEEKVYIADVDWRLIIKSAEMIDENMLNTIQAKLLGPRPNTYTFTKFLAENLVYEHRHEIPVLIFRPSIVGCTIYEPVHGFVENFNGPMGLSIGTVTGVLHVIYGNGQMVSDYIPCDYAINGLIAASWYRGIMDDDECPVVNAASGKDKNVTTLYLMEIILKIIKFFPPRKMIYIPWYVITENVLIYNFLVITTHLLPAIVLDMLLWLKGINFSLLKLYRKIYIANAALGYFITHSWNIVTDNFAYLHTILPPCDQKTLYMEIKAINNDEALYWAVVGMKKFLLKEDISEQALIVDKKNYQRLCWFDYIIKRLFLVFMAWISVKYVINLY